MQKIILCLVSLIMKNQKYILALTMFVLITNIATSYPIKSSKAQNNFVSRNKGLVIGTACVISGVAIYLVACFIKNKQDQNKINILEKENVDLDQDKTIQNGKNTDVKKINIELENIKKALNKKLNLATNDLNIFIKKLQEEQDQEKTKAKPTDDKQEAPNPNNINSQQNGLSTETIDYTIFIPTSPKQAQTLNQDSNTYFSETAQQENNQYIDPVNKTVDDPKVMDNGLIAKGVEIATETLTEASGELLKNIIFPDNARAHAMGIPDSELIARETSPLFVSDFQLTKSDWMSQVFGKDPMRRQKNHQPALIVSSNIC